MNHEQRKGVVALKGASFSEEARSLGSAMADARFSEISPARLARICERYGVQELALFGSALGDRFRPVSDVDLLVSFRPGTRPGFLTLGRLQRELEEVFGRAVDLVPKGGLKPAIRESVLASARVLYAA